MATLPDFSSTEFSEPTIIDNALFPLPAGAINSYGAEIVDPESGEEESERNDVFTTFLTKTIAGVETVVVRDTAYADGVLVEDTLDWYAQDDGGNVWYMGEIATNYNYDDDGGFTGADFIGSWEAGVDGAAPGWIMRASPMAGDSYFQEFYADVAIDEGEVIATGLSVETNFANFDGVVKIRDTSSLEPGVGGFKYFAPGVGQVLEEEFAEDEPSLFIEIENRRRVDDRSAVDPADLAFAGDGAEKTVTFLGEDAGSDGAIGAYAFDAATGVIGEARILFTDTEDLRTGARANVTVAAGQSLGLFLVPGGELGLDLEDYQDGGLFFRNPASGVVADLYDGDDDTTYTPSDATIHDMIAPVVTDSDGNPLPIRVFHAVGNRGGFNFLNPVAGENARSAGEGVIAFEDGLASIVDGDEDDGAYNGDFDDAYLAVFDEPLSKLEVEALVAKTGLSRTVGTDGDDPLRGACEDDQLISLDGDDVLRGRGGDDTLEAGDGDDRAYGGSGADAIFGEDGHDRLVGGRGVDEIEGGEGRDVIRGGGCADAIDGGKDDDRLYGGGGFDEIEGGEGADRVHAGRGGARLSGGSGDDTLVGCDAAADVFVFDLIPFGADTIVRFGDGADRVEIAGYLEVEGFADIDVEQDGSSTRLSFAEGDVELLDFDADRVDAGDFVFA